MKEDIFAALAPREERLELGGHTLIVREIASAADVVVFQDNADMTYKLIVRCVFDEAGEAVFTDGDIARLKSGAKAKLLPLIQAVSRVNGYAIEENLKNSAAAPGDG